MRSLRSLQSLDSKTALVTGGTGHIGRSVAEALAELGANVIVMDRDARTCKTVATDLKQRYSIDARGIACDLGNEKQLRKTLRTLKPLNIVVHTAGYVGTSGLKGYSVPFQKQTSAAWNEAMAVNLTSAFILAQECRKTLETGGNASMIFFSSIYGVVGPDFQMYDKTPLNNPAAYNASKGGLLQLTRYLSTLLAPKIRVNAISPGGVYRNHPALFHNRYKDKTPLRRMATEEDFKGAVAYLASDLSAYVTGHNLIVDGGWTAW